MKTYRPFVCVIVFIVVFIVSSTAANSGNLLVSLSMLLVVAGAVKVKEYFSMSVRVAAILLMIEMITLSHCTVWGIGQNSET